MSGGVDTCLIMEREKSTHSEGKKQVGTIGSMIVVLLILLCYMLYVVCYMLYVNIVNVVNVVKKMQVGCHHRSHECCVVKILVVSRECIDGLMGSHKPTWMPGRG